MRHHNHQFENKYCTGCQSTTRHEVKESSFACLRCGVQKYPAAILNAVKKIAIPVCI